MRYHYFFFFSSRRRHTRCSRDWSSDVCSSDLADRCARLASSGTTPPNTWCTSCERMTRPASSGRRRSPTRTRSEEHTSELQSRLHLVCRLLLEKKKQQL